MKVPGIGVGVDSSELFIPTLRGRGARTKTSTGRTNYQLVNATPTGKMIPRREERKEREVKSVRM